MENNLRSQNTSKSAPGLNSNRELSLIDRSLAEIPPIIGNYRHLVSINLHGNNIPTIRGLDQLSNSLRFLDLSSNRIASMNGLANLHELIYLNLASNRIVTVGSIAKLRNLRYINLAYNRITGLAGFRQLALNNMSNCSLERIDLHGNSISSIDLVITALCEFPNLRELHFSKDGASNPVCSKPSYRSRLLSSLSSLSLLDGSDRFGNPVMDVGWLQQDDVMSDLVLSLIDNKVMDDDIDEVSRAVQKQSKIGIQTPHVDAVLSRIRAGQQRALENFEQDVEVEMMHQDTKPIKETPKSGESPPVMAAYEGRLKELEQEITRLKSSVGQQSANLIGQPTQKHTKRIADAEVQAQEPPVRIHSSRRDTPKDADQRRDAAKTFGELARQIESERERRFKAETAAKRLTDSIRSMEEKIRQCQEIAATSEIEYNARKKAEEEVKRLNGELQEANLRLPELDSLLRKSKAECGRLKDDMDDCSRKLLISEKRALEAENESKRLYSQVSDLERRLHDVQATLASREAQHRREASGKDTIDRVSAIETLWKERLEAEKQKTDDMAKKYRQLEDEFRDALRIEANRFESVDDELRKTIEEDRQTKLALKSAENRLTQHQQASAQLTSVVKSLKVKLNEQERIYLGKFNELETRIAQKERELGDARKQGQSADMLRQEKVKLIAEVQALQSVVEGLRAERKNWGEELAKQGAQLSSDRGRLESKIESLTVEVTGLRRELDREVEAVKIKTKLIDDQLDTIRKLKDTLIERDRDLKETRSEVIDLQKQIEEKDFEINRSAEALEISDRRASELKKRAIELQQQFSEEKQQREADADKWRTRITGIAELESRVNELQSSAQEKEKQLHDEKTKLAMELEAARERIRVLDDRFREQLDLTKVEHARNLERVKSDAENEVAKGRTRVRQVEEEMRDLLAETEAQRREMEQRVKQLQTGLGQLVGLDTNLTTPKKLDR